MMDRKQEVIDRMNEWIADGNAAQFGPDAWGTQCTLWSHTFTSDELYSYFYNEYYVEYI
jgi:hypothetical protein